MHCYIDYLSQVYEKCKKDADYPNRTSDLLITSETPYHLAKPA